MWELDYKKSEHWRTGGFELWYWRRLLKSPLGCKEIKPVNPKGNQSWVFIGRTDAEAEAPILWPPHEKSWLIGKDPDAGKDWRQEEKGVTEIETVGWHHRLNGHQSEQTPANSERQGSLACSVYGVPNKQLRLSNWTTTLFLDYVPICHYRVLSIVPYAIQ